MKPRKLFIFMCLFKQIKLLTALKSIGCRSRVSDVGRVLRLTNPLSTTTPQGVVLAAKPGQPYLLSKNVNDISKEYTKEPGFKSQSRRCRVIVLGKLFTPIVAMFTKQ